MFQAVARFWSELRRRRVIKTTLAYLVGAWLIIEASSVVFPALLLPEWSVRIVIVLAILALPLVIVLAWVFDIERKREALTGLAIVETADLAERPPVLDSAIASVAVLPLEDLSADGDQKYLADGIAAELHIALARVHRVRVAARTSAMVFRDSQLDVREIANRLGVQYVVSGSVRRARDRMRINVCLDNAVEGMQIWSETYDREMSDVLSVQQEIAQAVAGAFGGARLREEIANVSGRNTENLGAWSLVQRARSFVLAFTPDALEEAIPLLRQAIHLDADYAAAHATLAFVLAEQKLNALAADPDESRSQAMAHANRAHLLAPVDPFVLKMSGAAWAYLGAVERSLTALRQAVRLAPFDFGAWGYLGWPLVATGDSRSLRELHQIMERIYAATPQHPGAPYWLYHRSVACSCERRTEGAVEFAQQAVESNPVFPWGLFQLANALGSAGRAESARSTVARSLEINPALTASHYQDMIREMSCTDEVAGLRLAGLYESAILET